jgi:hypothetical protein
LPRPAAARTSVIQDAASGVRFILADPSLRTLLAATGLFAAFLLPMISLCVPLLVRAHHWSSSVAGLTLGASACGGLALSLLIARLGTFPRTGLVTGVGPLVAAAGMAGVALATTAPVTFVSAVIQGIGTGLFTSHLGPLFMTRASKTHLARAQSMLVLVQTIPLLFSNNIVAAIAAHAGATAAALTCTSGTAAAGICLLTLPQLRNATLARATAQT